MMDELQSLQKEVHDLYLERGYTAGPLTLCLGATEELGELAQALLLTQAKDFIPSERKKSEWPQAFEPSRIAYEVGDIITYLLALCNALEISPNFKWKEICPSEE